MYNAVIAEDESWSMANIKSIFPWANYNFEEPKCFSDARDALAFISQNKIDVLFTDIKMPGMSGLDLIKQVRERNGNLKIIVISGHANFSFAQQSIKHNVFSYLLKPVTRSDAEELIMKLKNVLDSEYGYDDINKHENIPSPTFQKMLYYIDEHYNEKMQLNNLAERFHFNETYGSHLFHKYFGCGFTEYVTNIKMKKAVELLNSDMSITEIASFLNYDYAYFNKLFKKSYGYTPRQYIQKYRRKNK